jgi:excisionase family DNA binding protein
MAESLLLDQAAELLGVSRRTVYYRIRDGRLRTIRARCGSQRVLVDSIEALLRQEAERLRGRHARASTTRRRAASSAAGTEMPAEELI